MNIKTILKNIDQQQLLRFESQLSKAEMEELENQIAHLDFSYLEHLGKEKKKEDAVITPIKAITVDEIEEKKEYFEKVGLAALSRGEVGLVLLAGGMGTRLGSDSPKGVYNIGKTRDVFIFQRLFENALEVVERCGRHMPFFIMTSEKNNEETVAFLEEKNYFGYDKNMIRFFVQDMAPCVDFNGKVLLEEKNRVATSPNGHGGWLKSLLDDKDAKALIEKSKIKWMNVFAVDNVLQKMADPIFVGATIDGGFEVGAKVVKKADPYEKVGVMCKKNGHPCVIEYIDLSEEYAHKTDEKGERLYNYGAFFNYLFKLDMLYRIKDSRLPIRIVTKKVEYIDENGNKVKPEQPNAYKFEMLGADMVELGQSCLPFEVIREKEFAPIKNKTGVDSVESAQALLEKNGYIL